MIVNASTNQQSTGLIKLVDLVLSDTTIGYISRTILELFPLGIWAVGDILGVLKGIQSLNQGKNLIGIAKLLTAIIPFFPTAPTHFLLDKLFPNHPTNH